MPTTRASLILASSRPELDFTTHFADTWSLQEAPEEGGSILQYYENPPATAVRRCVWVDPGTQTFYYMFLD